MNEKFKMQSSTLLPFAKMTVAATAKESYHLAFTELEEEQWISKIAHIVISENPKPPLQNIVNTTDKQSSYPQQLASETAKIFSTYYLK